MASFELTQVQKNEVFQTIVRAGLDPSEFKWAETISSITEVGAGNRPYTVEVLTHLPTGYTFTFDVQMPRSSLWAIFRPGPDGARRREHAGSWSYVMGYLGDWTAHVKRDHEAPDLWAQMQAPAALLEPPPTEEVANTPFTEPERLQIAQELNEMKELIQRGYDLQAEQLRDLEARVDYLTDATERLGRSDWKQVLGRELVGLVLRAIIPVQAFHEAVHFLWRGIGHLLGGDGVPELPGGPPEIM